MSDLISRQAAIEALGERPMVWVESDYELGARNQYDADVLALETVPSAQPEQRWIPCSERVPRKNGFYLCTTKDCITILEFRGGNPHYHEKPSFVSDVLGRCNSYVVAWMPLPEPYKTESEDKE